MPQMGQRHIQTKASDLARPRSVNAWNWGLRHEVARGVRVRVRVRVRVGWGWGWVVGEEGGFSVVALHFA